MKAKGQISIDQINRINCCHKMNHNLIDDFMDNLQKQRDKAKKMKKPMPPPVRDIGDFIQLVQLELLLLEQMPEEGKEERNREEEVYEEFLKADPEAGKLLKELYRRQTVFMESKRGGGRT